MAVLHVLAYGILATNFIWYHSYLHNFGFLFDFYYKMEVGGVEPKNLIARE